MVNVDAFYKAGGYDEKVILDFSDIRFMEKFQKIYPEFYAIREVVCLQEFSIEERDFNKLMVTEPRKEQMMKSLWSTVATRLVIIMTILTSTCS